MNSLYFRYSVVSTIACFIGLTTFAVAQQNAFIALLALPASLGSFLLFRDNLISPLPRWLINVLLACAALNMIRAVDASPEETVGLIGEYLVWLHVIKLYEDRNPRNQSQLLVLSFLLIVAAVLTSVSLWIGLMLVLYAPVALSWAVLFQMFHGAYRALAAERAHVWRSTDTHRQPPASRVTTKQMQQARRLVLAGAVAAFAMASLIFLLMPRNIGEGALGAWPTPRAGAQTGFNDHIQLGATSGNISESNQEVMTATIERSTINPLTGRRDTSRVASGVFLLRGLVLDEYDTDQDLWQRSAIHTSLEEPVDGGLELVRGTPLAFLSDDVRYTLAVNTVASRADGEIAFSLWAPTAIEAGDEADLRFEQSAADGVLRVKPRRRSGSSIAGASYLVRSGYRPPVAAASADTPSLLTADGFLAKSQIEWLQHASKSTHPLRDNPFRSDPSLEPIRELALQIADDAGIDLEADPEWYASVIPPDAHEELPLDLLAEIAPPRRANELVSAFDRYLSRNYFYTLDLERTPAGVDPIVYFLERRGRGHCEYFASALAGLCRAVNINARVVIGYVATETDPVGERFVIRERHAHAWVEAEVAPGVWRTFDPSPRDEVRQFHEAQPGLLATISRLFDRVEAAWIHSIITFDQSHQARVFGMQTDGDFEFPALIESTFGPKREDETQLAHAARSAISFVVLFLVCAVLVAGAYLASAKLRDALRAARQRGGDPLAADRLRRAHLPAYAEMLDRLERTRFAKPASVPPMRFADSLEAEQPRIAELVRTITALYYDARFADRTLAPAERQRAADLLGELDAAIAAAESPLPDEPIDAATVTNHPRSDA